jgi:hypothetical protein
MKLVLKIVSWMALALLVVSPLLFYSEKISLEQNKVLLLVATIIWFATAPFWILRRDRTEEESAVI